MEQSISSDSNFVTKKEKFNYYVLQFEDGRVLKGEANGSLKKFRLNFVNDTQNGKFMVETPFDIKMFKTKLKVMMDFRNGIMHLFTPPKPLDKISKKKEKKYKFIKINWIVILNKDNMNTISSLKEKCGEFFSNLTFDFYIEIRRQVKYALKRLFYYKFAEIDSFFFDTLEVERLNKISEQFINDYISFKNESKKYFLNKSENIKSTSLQIKREIESFYKKYLSTIEEYIIEIIEKIISTYFSNFFNQYVQIENFYIEEKSAIPNIDYSSIYLFEKSSEVSIKIKNSACILNYNKSENLLTVEVNNKMGLNSSNIILLKTKLSKVNQIEYLKLKVNNKHLFALNNLERDGWVYFGELLALEGEDLKNGFGAEYSKINPYQVDNESKSDDFNYFIGNYSKNLFNGNGILDTKYFFYKGEFSSGNKFGKIKEMYFKNENLSLEGEFLDDKSIKGKVIYNNGDCYIGEFNEKGQKKGVGQYLTKNGNTVQLKYDEKGNELKGYTKYNY